MLLNITNNLFNIVNRCQSKKDPFKYQYVSTVGWFIPKKIGFSELETYFDDINNVHCFELNTG